MEYGELVNQSISRRADIWSFQLYHQFLLHRVPRARSSKYCE